LILRLSTPKTTIFSKRGWNNALIRPAGSPRDVFRRFWPEVLFAKRRIDAPKMAFGKIEIGENRGKRWGKISK